MIATWWSSTLETAVPHPMNQFPMILGFLELHRGKVGGGDWLAEARRVGDGLVDSIGPDGMLRNCWADIPGKKTGSVIFTGPAWALAELYRATNNPQHLQGARTLLDTTDKYWVRAGIDSYGVANQGFKWADALLSLGRATGEKVHIDRARRAARKYLDQQISEGPMRGAFYQSRSDDRLISVYQGKCLGPLLRFYEEFEDPDFLKAAVSLGHYMLRQETRAGIFVNYHEAEGKLYRTLRSVLARLDYRILRRRGAIYKGWRPFISSWTTFAYPSFIARSADSIRALWLLTKYVPEIQDAVARITIKLISFQLPHGGFPNSVGFVGSDCRVDWQDICCPTRWNAYAFFLLSFLMGSMCPGQSVDVPAYSDRPFEQNVGKERDLTYRETVDAVELRRHEELIARLAKPSGESLYLADGWGGDLSDYRGGPNLEKS